ncbi:MAG: hypothetical protein ABW221_22250 [Vicinamibacteria bacterium]
MLRRVASVLCLLLLPLLVAAASHWVALARGPIWLATNQDPDYTYLLNALSVSDGAAPGHVDHPGTPVQAGGALVLQAAHRLLGGDTDRAKDVLAQPEMYLGLLNTLLVGLYSAALWICGRVVFQMTHSLTTALLAQSAPLLSSLVLLELPTFKPEPLLLSIATGMAVLVARTLGGGGAGTRLVLAMGALAGVGVATKVTAAPLLLVPLLLAAGWAQRARVLGACAVAFAGATFPGWTRAADFFGFQRRVATQPGMYGLPELVGLAPYGGALRTLLAAEWVVPVLCAAAVAVLVLRRETSDPRGRATWRALLALTAAQLGQLALVATHPYQARYVVPALGLLGLTVALLLHCAGRARVVLAAVLLAASVVEMRALVAQVRVLRVIARLQTSAQPVVEEYARCPVVTYYRSSSVAEAMRQANALSGGRYARRLDAIHAGSLFLSGRLGQLKAGQSNIRTFGGAVPFAALERSPCLLFRGSPGGPLHPFAQADAFERAAIPLAGELTLLADSTMEAVRLLTPHGFVSPGPFSGWTGTEGLGDPEGPFPQRGIDRVVRWGLGRATRLSFDGPAGPARLEIEATSYVPDQAIVFSIDGRRVARLPVGRDGGFVRHALPFDAHAGEGTLTLEYERSFAAQERERAVLFCRLSLERLASPAR